MEAMRHSPPCRIQGGLNHHTSSSCRRRVPSSISARDGGGQAEGFEIPAVLAVPGFRQGLERGADVDGRQVAEREDQLASDAGVGVVGQREKFL